MSPKNRFTVAVAITVLAFAAAACGDRKAAGGSNAAAAGGAPAAGTPATPATPAPSAATPVRPDAYGLVKAGLLPVGTVIRAQLINPMSSFTNKPGEVVQASVIDSVFDSSGELAVWGGARVDLRIVTLTTVGGGATPSGKVELTPVSLRFGSDTVPISGTVDSVPYLARGSNIIVERATRVTVRLSRKVTLHP